MKLKNYGQPYWNEGKFRRQKTINDKKIVILSLSGIDSIREQGWKNLLAVDKEDNILWIADLPTSLYDCYYDMKFENSIIYAHSSNGLIAEIELETGQILKSYVVK